MEKQQVLSVINSSQSASKAPRVITLMLPSGRMNQRATSIIARLNHFALGLVGNPFFGFIVEKITTIEHHNNAHINKFMVGQAAMKLVNDIALVVDLVRGLKALLTMKYNSVC